MRNPVQTPSSITGSDCTAVTPTRILVDWLAFTAPVNTPLPDLLPRSDRLSWTVAERGALGYRQQLVSGGVHYYTDGSPTQGVHVVISGSGCREIEAAGCVDQDYLGGWPGYLKLITDSGWNITRLDLAIDETDGVLKIEELANNITSGHCVSQWNKVKRYPEWNTNGELIGDGLSIGSRVSNKYLRIYNKALEWKSKKHTESPNKHWIRVEIELKQESANEIAAIIAAQETLGVIVESLLRHYLQFKQQVPTDSNKRRWPLLPSWSTFLGNVARLKLSTAPEVRTIETVKRWIKHQVAPMLSVVVSVAGGDLDFVLECVTDGLSRLQPRHLKLLTSAPELAT